MAEFKPGEIVDITIKGARVEETLTEGHDADVTQVLRVAITGRHGGMFYAVFPLDWANAVVERVAPAEWPPQPGDLWRDAEDDLWFVRTWLDDDQLKIGLVCGRRVPGKTGVLGGSLSPKTVMTKFGPLTLVHRETEVAGS